MNCRIEALEARRLLSVVHGGRIFMDSNDNGLPDAGETLPAALREQVSMGFWYDQGDGHRGWENLVVRVQEDGQFTVTVHTDAPGELAFYLDGMPPPLVQPPPELVYELTPTIARMDLLIPLYESHSSVQGRAFLDTNENGVWDDGEKPAVGVEIGSEAYFARTDATGAWRMNLPWGPARLRVEFPHLRTHDWPLQVELARDEALVMPDLGVLRAPSLVAGRVRLDRNGDGDWSNDGLGYGGAVVYGDLDEDGVLDDDEPRTTSDDTGVYRLITPADRTVLVRVEVPSPLVSRHRFWRVQTQLNRETGQSIELTDTSIRETFVQGRVVHDSNYSGAVEASDEGFEGARVFLDVDRDGVEDAGEPAAVTDVNGGYRIELGQVSYGALTAVLPTGTERADGPHVRYISMGDQLQVDFTTRREIDARASLPTDFDGDGRPDAVLARADERHRVQVGSEEAFDLVRPTGDGWVLGAVADFDGDMLADVVWHNDLTGATELHLMQGETVRQRRALSTLDDVAWRLVGAGDFDADGEDDLLWRHASDGRVVVWKMEGTMHVDSAALAQVRQPAWEVKAVVDIDYDGDADVLWYNAASHQVLWWYMDGPRVQGFKTSGVLPVARRIVGCHRPAAYEPLKLLWEGDGLSSGADLAVWDLDAWGNVLKMTRRWTWS